MRGTIRGTFRSAWAKNQKRRCTILLFSLFFRIFRAKNRRNILVDDTTKRCYTLGNKTTLCNAKERGVSMNEMKEAVGNWREAKQFSPADENDFLR